MAFSDNLLMRMGREIIKEGKRGRGKKEDVVTESNVYRRFCQASKATTSCTSFSRDLGEAT